jgi:hypothetical protein
MNPKLKAAIASAAVLDLTLIGASLATGTGIEARAMNLAILALASGAGWLIGTIISPYDSKEEAAFSNYSKAVSAFASGYLVAKIDKIVEHVFSPEFLATPDAAFRMILFLGGFIIAVLITFVARRYG